MGVSVENAKTLDRVRHLAECRLPFLSCGPLLGPLDKLPLRRMHWAILGGESGPGARPMKPEWVDSILLQCRDAEVAFFFKQWGGVPKDRAGRQLHGRTYDEMPRAVA
jgi:protein gp37